MIITTGTDTTPPPDIEVINVQGMQKKSLPGFYNSTCGPFTGNTCHTQLNLQCVNGRCVCFDNFEPTGTGGCKEDPLTALVTWLIRLFVSASVFIICLTIFHLLISGRRRRRRREEDNEEDGRSSTWYDEPPAYGEAVDESPPPTYLEAVAKESECGSEAPPTTATERATPPRTARAPVRREVETVSSSPPSYPAPPDTHTHQTLHM